MRGYPALLITMLLFLTIPPSSAQFDVSVAWVKGGKNPVGEGELVRVEAKIVNQNTEVSRAFAVSFYYDETDDSHLIGRVFYDSIYRYRIPSLIWDTKGKEGEHTIIVHVRDEYGSNYGYASIIVAPTKRKNADVLITEVYYHARPHRSNEYLCIANTGKEEVPLYGWYMTTEPWKRADAQNRIVFPNVTIRQDETIYITQNATSFSFESGLDADYEYYNCSPAPNMERNGKFIMANDGGVVCLKDPYNHTVDVVVYGDAAFHEGWAGKAIDGVGEGVVLKRNDSRDTNTSADWEYNRTFIIGQSDFQPWHGMVEGAVAFCSPDCSYEVISEALENADTLRINLYMFTNPFIARILNESTASIQLFLDGNVIGGIPMEERWIAYVLNRGGEVRYMLQDEEGGIYKRYRYNHAKYVVMDDACIIQSANWGMTGIPPDPTYGNREWGIIIRDGNASAFLETVFDADWDPGFQDSIAFDEESFTHGKPPADFSPLYHCPHGEYTPRFSPLAVESRCNVTIILSPDNAEEELLALLDGAKEEILVEQAYIEKDWTGGVNPLLKKLVEKNESGVRVRVIMNYNPGYHSTSAMNREVYDFLKERGIEVRLQGDMDIHNKGVVVDGSKVLISSINWGENSVRNNREVGIVVENEEIAGYFQRVFEYDWEYAAPKEKPDIVEWMFILSVFAVTFLVIYLYKKR